MSEFDLLIRGGTIVDGLRTPRYISDIAVKDGRIASIGRLAPHRATRVLDASGLVVAPGFVDLHTHYDSQIFWDPWCTISGWHGVTSVAIGNCGFGFAPVRSTAADRDRAMLTMSRNEAVPLECMQEGMPWDWESFPEFLDSVERTAKGVNVLSYVGLNPLMAYVMGWQEAKERAATEDELARMCTLLREAMMAGACGWSAQLTGLDTVQRDYDGTPMITDLMTDRDLFAFAEVLGDLGYGFIQMAGKLPVAARLAELSGRPVVWNLLAAATDQHGAPMVAHRDAIEYVKDANERRGLRVFAQALTVDVGFEFTLEHWNLFDSSPAWREVTLGERDERMAKMRDPVIRAALRAEYDAGRGPVAGGGTEERDVRVGSGIAELVLEWVMSNELALKKLEGMTVGEIAREQGRHPVDVLLDVSLADDLRAGFGTPPRHTNVEAMREIANSDYALPGVSDGGAHTKFITNGTYPTDFLTQWVRTHELMSLEDAHWRLSAYPALAAGFRDRGWLREGSPADIVVYDFDALSLLPTERTYDFPAGAWRLTKKADGYRWIVVNGEVTFEDGVGTGRTPGTLLRHGRQA